jgi:predicted lipid-binding transport protein (Tim44 family)
MLQVALIAGLAYAALAYFRSRQQPALARGPAGAGAAPERNASDDSSGNASAAPDATPLLMGSADYDAFERLLGEIQSAFSREDMDTLGEMTTPEMLSYFSRELADNKDSGVHNEVADVKLLQGDLSESWREAGSDYATVAMRFSLRDVMVDRATGRVVSGDGSAAQQATEVWTFRRDHREPLQGWQQGWQLSAIQQAA